MMNVLVAPIGTYRYDKTKKGFSSLADELFEDEKLSPELEEKLAEDLKIRKTYIVIFQTRDHEENMVKVRATDPGRAQMIFEKAYSGAMLMEEDLTSNEKPYMSSYRWDRKAETRILTEEEYELRQNS